jgi:hypothetical protein
MRNGAPILDILLTRVDFLENVDLVLNVFNRRVVGQSVEQSAENFLGRHEYILPTGRRIWYALIKEFRTAVRSFVESSPVDLTGKQPDAQRPCADRQGDIIL